MPAAEFPKRTHHEGKRTQCACMPGFVHLHWFYHASSIENGIHLGQTDGIRTLRIVQETFITNLELGHVSN